MKTASWEDCLRAAETMSGKYSMSDAEQEIMYQHAMRLPPSSTIVEIGVCNGRTAAVLCYASKYKGHRYFGVDNFSLENTREGVQAGLDALGYSAQLLVGDSSQVPWDHGHIDLLIIDGGHYEEAVKKDCERWIPFVKSGGVVAWHDYDKVYDPASCHHSIREHADRITKKWEILYTPETSCSLFIARKP